MRFLKRVRAQSPQDAAVGARLSAVADRGKLESSDYSGIEEPPGAQSVQQRFWTPREVEERVNRE